MDIWTSYGEAAAQNAFPKYFLGNYTVGTTIGSSLGATWSGNAVRHLEYNGSGNSNGNWDGGGMGFAALRIESNSSPGNYNYGWARINYDDTNATITLLDFAYETTMNQSIIAGDTGSGVVPEPSRALLLALGLGGAALRRRRQKA